MRSGWISCGSVTRCGHYARPGRVVRPPGDVLDSVAVCRRGHDPIRSRLGPGGLAGVPGRCRESAGRLGRGLFVRRSLAGGLHRDDRHVAPDGSVAAADSRRDVGGPPDRPPLAWLLTRPDRGALLRLYGLAVGFPILVGLLRLTFLALGQTENGAFALAVLGCTAILVVVGFRLRHQEQSLLKDRAEAQMRYRILADNAVDIIVHLHGNDVAWISPSVEAALGGPPDQWIGSGFRRRIHPDDLDTLADALRRIANGDSVLHRFRVRSLDGGYHWVDGHGKPYMDAQGTIDGLIAALRVADDRVKAEQQLERLARFDTLTGLANRAEAISRLESALAQPPADGTHLGILFCDIDHFKTINDTFGHGTGDTVLTTVATRIRESVRKGDTVGRTGGDEMLVVLPDVGSMAKSPASASRSALARPNRSTNPAPPSTRP